MGTHKTLFQAPCAGSIAQAKAHGSGMGLERASESRTSQVVHCGSIIMIIAAFLNIALLVLEIIDDDSGIWLRCVYGSVLLGWSLLLVLSLRAFSKRRYMLRRSREFGYSLCPKCFYVVDSVEEHSICPECGSISSFSERKEFWTQYGATSYCGRVQDG